MGHSFLMPAMGDGNFGNLPTTSGPTGGGFGAAPGVGTSSSWGWTPPWATGSNQYGQYPTIPTPVPGGGQPYSMGNSPFNWLNLAAGQKPGQFWETSPGGKMDMGGGVFTAPTMDPAFTNQYFSQLEQMMPGGNFLQNQLMNFLSGGPSATPGASQLATMAQTGSPISAMPEWQAMVDAMQQNISRNEAGLKEQFGAAGELQSSPFGDAMQNFLSQTTKDQNALLGQLQTGALENAMQRQEQTGLALQQLGGQEGQFLQQLFAGGGTASPGLFSQQKGSALPGIGALVSGIGGMSTGGGGTVAGDLLGFLGL